MITPAVMMRTRAPNDFAGYSSGLGARFAPPAPDVGEPSPPISPAIFT